MRRRQDASEEPGAVSRRAGRIAADSRDGVITLRAEGSVEVNVDGRQACGFDQYPSRRVVVSASAAPLGIELTPLAGQHVGLIQEPSFYDLPSLLERQVRIVHGVVWVACDEGRVRLRAHRP